MYSFFQWSYFVFLTMVLVRTIPASGDRQRRFLTPTTYPVPTIPVNSLVAGSISSVPVRCPLKREIGDQLRVSLDHDMMREMYFREVGNVDRRFLAETLGDAMIQFRRINHKSAKIMKNGTKNRLLYKIRDWLRSRNGNTTTDYRYVDGSNQQVNTSQYPKSERRTSRIRRNTDGSVTRIEYCTPRGKKTPDGYLHMCASCAMTTILPDDKFPRYINEVACDSSDCKCFDVRGTSHGKCKVRIHHVKMLRKVPKGCRMTIFNGQQVITDAWEIYDYPLRVGCECVINKQSMFATFIPKPVG